MPSSRTDFAEMCVTSYENDTYNAPFKSTKGVGPLPVAVTYYITILHRHVSTVARKGKMALERTHF